MVGSTRGTGGGEVGGEADDGEREREGGFSPLAFDVERCSFNSFVCMKATDGGSEGGGDTTRREGESSAAARG